MNKTINKKKVFKVVSILLVLIIILVVGNMYIMSRDVIYGRLDQTVTLRKGQVLKLVDENISLKIVGFDAEGCSGNMPTAHECTDVYIKIGDDPSEEKCSMWFSCKGYRYFVQDSDYKTYAKIRVIKSDE